MRLGRGYGLWNTAGCDFSMASRTCVNRWIGTHCNKGFVRHIVSHLSFSTSIKAPPAARSFLRSTTSLTVPSGRLFPNQIASLQLLKR